MSAFGSGCWKGRALRLGGAALLLAFALAGCVPGRPAAPSPRPPVQVTDPDAAWRAAVAATAVMPGYTVQFNLRLGENAELRRRSGIYQFNPQLNAGLLQVTDEVQRAEGATATVTWDAFVLPQQIVVYDRQLRRWTVPRDSGRTDFVHERWLPDIVSWTERLQRLQQAEPGPGDPALLRGEVVLQGEVADAPGLAAVVRILPEGRLRSVTVRDAAGAAVVSWAFQYAKSPVTLRIPESVQHMLTPLPPDEQEKAVLQVARDEARRARAPANVNVQIDGVPLADQFFFPFWEVFASAPGYFERFLVDQDSLEIRWRLTEDRGVDHRPRPRAVPGADTITRLLKEADRSDRLAFLNALTHLRLYMMHDPKAAGIGNIARQVDPTGAWLRLQRPAFGTTVVQVEGSTEAFGPGGRGWWMLHFEGNRAPYFREEVGAGVYAWDARSAGYNARPSFIRWIRHGSATGPVAVGGWYLDNQLGWWEPIPERSWSNIPAILFGLEVRQAAGLYDATGIMQVGFESRDKANLGLCAGNECARLVWVDSQYQLEQAAAR